MGRGECPADHGTASRVSRAMREGPTKPAGSTITAPSQFWGTNNGQSIEPQSWADCLQLLLCNGGQHIWYRGQRCYEWGLLTTLERSLRTRATSGGPLPFELSDLNVLDLWDSHVEDPRLGRWVHG